MIVTEKPSVAISYAKILGVHGRQDGYLEGNGYLVSWCVGHLVELAPPSAYGEQYVKWNIADLPILPEKWQYLVSASTKKQFGILKKLMHRADVNTVVNSCDAGREGELIFRLVYEQAGCKKPVSRLWLSSMEDSAVRAGFANLKPSTEYDALYQAALCRERADWMVGINCSRLFSCLYGRPLAVGRVMTPTLAMTVEREAAIAAFVPKKFYTVALELTSGFVASSRRISEKAAAEKLLAGCREEMVSTIQKITRKEKAENPPPLYDLTTLQRDANRLLGYSAQQTLDYVQSLYEKQLTTYPRTDSCYIADEDEEMLSKRQYELATGRRQKSDVIAYQIRQSFKPGEITAEEANKVGYELAMRFTKGKYAFIVATHTDREHIHNHIIYNSTALGSTRKFRDFLLSGLAVQRLSDLICLEHQLSVIETKPYRERQKRTLYPPKESNRDRLCSVIDTILAGKPKGYEDFLQKLEQQGYEVKRGKYTSVKGKRQKRFIRFKTLGAGYSEEEMKAVIAGDAEHCPHQKQPPKEQPFHLLVDIQAKLSEGKSEGYARWAKKYNLKEMSKTLIFLQEKKIGSIKEMQERVDAATARYHELGDSIKAAETRMAEIAVLRTHILNYAKTRPVYDAYRKAGYSKRFLENHRAEITLHKAAKAAFDESNLKTLPKVKELDAEYSKLLTEKKALYPDYRKAKDEMQELLRAQRNVELFFAEEKNTTEKTQSR